MRARGHIHLLALVLAGAALAGPKAHAPVLIHASGRCVLLIKDGLPWDGKFKLPLDDRKLLSAGMTRLSHDFPDVHLSQPSDKELELVVAGKRLHQVITDVDSLWRLAFAFNDMLAFVQQAIGPACDARMLREMEASFWKGVMPALDPDAGFFDAAAWARRGQVDDGTGRLARSGCRAQSELEKCRWKRADGVYLTAFDAGDGAVLLSPASENPALYTGKDAAE